jgi:ABC-type glycerol-3-phosphate transport system substrate-binding protein
MRVLLAGSLTLAALALAACGGSSGSGSSANDVNVQLVVPLASGAGIQSLASSSGEANEDGSPGEVDGVDPGQSKSVTLDLKPGTYVLLCNEPGHFAGGMATTFTVN